MAPWTDYFPQLAFEGEKLTYELEHVEDVEDDE